MPRMAARCSRIYWKLLTDNLHRRFLFHFGEVFSGSGGEFVPQFPGENDSHDREGHEENGPPLPVTDGEVAKAHRLQTAAEIGEAVDDSGTGCGCFASAEIGGGGAGHEGRDANAAHPNPNGGEAD